MKNLILTAGILVLFGRPSLASSYLTLPIIDRENGSFGISVTNNDSQDLFCESVQIDVRLEDIQFGEPEGSFPFLFENIYVFSNRKIEDKFPLAENGVNLEKTNIRDVLIKEVNCHPARLSDYCQFALEKSTEESHTLDLLFKEARTQSCRTLESHLGTKLSLKEEGIQSFYPLSFLTKLEKLYLQGNNIEELTNVSNMKGLKVLRINKNPVTNIDKAIRLPNIVWVDASETKVNKIDLTDVKPHMRESFRRSKGTHVFHTPYLERISNLERAVTN